MNAISVFIGASLGINSTYLAATQQLGKALAKRNIKLVYGGGKFGLMGALANTVLENGGQVHGVITNHLHAQEAHLGLSKLHVVESMHERKQQMMHLSDGFMVLPGGLGTLEEIFEIWNASKLEIHNKPIGLLNVNNYYNNLIEFIDHSVCQGFLKSRSRKIIQVSTDPNTLLDMLISKNTTSQRGNKNTD